MINKITDITILPKGQGENPQSMPMKQQYCGLNQQIKDTTSFSGKEEQQPKKNNTMAWVLGLGATIAAVAVAVKMHKKVDIKASEKAVEEIKPKISRSYGGGSRRTTDPSPINEGQYQIPFEEEYRPSGVKPPIVEDSVITIKQPVPKEQLEIPFEEFKTKTKKTSRKKAVKIEKQPNIPSDPKGTLPTEEESLQKITEILTKSQSSKDLSAGAKKAAREANEIADMRRSFPELIAHREERSAIIKKNRLKEEDEKIDIQYFKDDFRAFVTIPVDRLNNLRKSTNPELKEMFNIDRTNFLINEGVMINGTNAKAKKELLTHFISEAKKHDMEVIRIPAGDTDPEVFAQKVAELFPKAKLKFANEKKATMFVMEDMDKMLNFKDPKQSALCGPARGQMNVHTNECGTDGVIWVSTVKDVSQLDESSVRGGRVKHIIDIDNLK